VAAYAQEPDKDTVAMRDLFTLRLCLAVTRAAPDGPEGPDGRVLPFPTTDDTVTDGTDEAGEETAS
jgi:hypothetical protein